MTYEDFRTGLTFRDVRQMLWVASSDSSKWRHKRRNTVLGHWRALKLAMWREYQRREDEICSVVSDVASCESPLPF